MSWCRLICKPWPQHYPRIADEVTANRTARSAMGTQQPVVFQNLTAGLAVGGALGLHSLK